MYNRLTGIDGKENYNPLPARRELYDLRETFVAALDPQPMQVDTRQLGSEVAARSNDPPHAAGTDGRVIRVRVVKCADGARWHSASPKVQTMSDPTSAVSI